MGATASVLIDQAPMEIKSLTEICNIQLVKILEHDHDVIDEEMSKIFKKHSVIIDTITSHTKSQLSKFYSMTTATNSSGLFALLKLHNNYSEFLKLLFLKKENIENESFKASAQAEYDEGVLKSIVGTSSCDEIMKFRAVYETQRRISLSEVVKLRAQRNSHIQKFLIRALRGDREESDTVDRDAALLQAKELHRAGASRFFGVEEEPIFNILAVASRAQCVAISQAYESAFSMTLTKAIKKKFSGNISKLLILWIQPLPHSVATLLRNAVSKVFPNKLAIAKIVAKYEKNFLSQVDHACAQLFNMSLIKLLGKALSGNLYKAVKGWLENQSSDCGYENTLEEYIQGQVRSGKTANDLYDDPETVEHIRDLLQSRSDSFERFMVEKHIHFELPKHIDNSGRSGRSKHAHSAKIAKGSIGVLQAVGADKKAQKYGVKLGGEQYASKVRRVSGYLTKYFQSMDDDRHGNFETEDFWCIVKTLPVADLGLSLDQIDSMSEFCEWEHNGHINYHDAIGELSDSIIHAVEDGGEDPNADIYGIIDRLEEEDRAAAREAEQRKKNPSISHHSHKHDSPKAVSLPTAGTVAVADVKFGKKKNHKKQKVKLPNDVEMYIFDTVDAFDYDCKGFLCNAELKALVHSTHVKVPLDSFSCTDEDMYTHQDIVKVFARVIDAALQEPNEPLHLCFMDKDSGMNFWYDVQKATKKWVDAPTPSTIVTNTITPSQSQRADTHTPSSSHSTFGETASPSVHYIEESNDENAVTYESLAPLTEEEIGIAKKDLTLWLKETAKIVPAESIGIYVDNLVAANVGSVATMATQLERDSNFLQSLSISHGNVARIQQALIRQKAAQLASSSAASDSAASAAKPIDTKDLCLICMENRKCMVFFPCGHLCVCEPCDLLMNRKQGVLCIMCRVEIANRAKLFVS